MRTEYDFTPEEKARLDEIDRQINELYSIKFNIYACARVRYVTETPEEVKLVERELINRMLLTDGGILANYGVLKKDGIANLKFADEESEE